MKNKKNKLLISVLLVVTTICSAPLAFAYAEILPNIAIESCVHDKNARWVVGSIYANYLSIQEGLNNSIGSDGFESYVTTCIFDDDTSEIFKDVTSIGSGVSNYLSHCGAASLRNNKEVNIHIARRTLTDDYKYQGEWRDVRVIPKGLSWNDITDLFKTSKHLECIINNNNLYIATDEHEKPQQKSLQNWNKSLIGKYVDEVNNSKNMFFTEQDRQEILLKTDAPIQMLRRDEVVLKSKCILTEFNCGNYGDLDSYGVKPSKKEEISSEEVIKNAINVLKVPVIAWLSFSTKESKRVINDKDLQYCPPLYHTVKESLRVKQEKSTGTIFTDKKILVIIYGIYMPLGCYDSAGGECEYVMVANLSNCSILKEVILVNIKDLDSIADSFMYITVDKKEKTKDSISEFAQDELKNLRRYTIDQEFRQSRMNYEPFKQDWSKR